jgi:hypothetical protein
MKKYILTLVIALFVSAINAQYTLSPLVKSASGSAAQDELITHAHVKNNSGVNATYIWYMTQKNFPNGWESAICDKNTCYDVSVTTASFDLAPGDSGTLEVHLYPHSVSGTASVEVLVYEKNTDSTTGPKATYSFNAWALNTKAAEKRSNNVEIYPNPATTQLNITLETAKPITIEVYNVLGQLKMKHTHNGGTSTMDLADLPAGIYFLRYTHPTTGQVVSKQFKKVQ